MADLDLSSDLAALRYIASYADLIQALGANPQAARNHYNVFGKAEGRTITFDPLFYAASNVDVAQVGFDLTAFTVHYINWGFAEHRLTHSFDAFEYGASNPDVAAALGANEQALVTHYVQWGINEHRPTNSFDPLQYGAVNTDLAIQYGLDTHGLTLHYLTTGVHQGRPTSGFNAISYLLWNQDVAASGGGAYGALIHWLQWGAREGRTGDSVYGRETNHDLSQLPGEAAGTIGVVDNITLGSVDHDWFTVNLTAGVSRTFSVHGVSIGGSLALANPDLAIFDSLGRMIAFDADSGPGLDPLLTFTPTTTGLYYIGVFGASNTEQGGYQLMVAPVTNTSTTFIDSQLHSGIVVNGSPGGLDQVFVIATPALANPNYSGFQFLDVDQLTVTNTNASIITFDMAGSTGLDLITIQGGTRGATFNGVTSLADLTINGLTTLTTDVTVQYQNAVVAGASDTIHLTFNNAKIDDLTLSTVSAAFAAIEHVQIVITGGQLNDSLLGSLGVDATDLTISGGGGLNIQDALRNTVRTITSSVTFGAVSVNFSNNDGAGQGVTYTGSNASVGVNTITAGDANDVITTFGGNDVITTGAGTDQVSTGLGIDRIIMGAGLDATDVIDGGGYTLLAPPIGDTLVIGDRNYADVDFTGVSNIDRLEITSFFNTVLGAQAQQGGIRNIAATSNAASLIDASAYTVGLTVDVSPGGNDTVITGSGADVVLIGLGDQTYSLGDGNDFVFAVLGLYNANDSFNGGGGTDELTLDNRGGSVTATVDLAKLISVERIADLAGQGTAFLNLTGGNALAPVNIDIIAGSRLTVTLDAGQTNANYGFHLFGSSQSTTLIKSNTGVANSINFTGGTGVDTLQVNVTDLTAALTMNGGLGLDRLVITGGIVTDTAFAYLMSVEELTSLGVVLDATVGATAMASGLANVIFGSGNNHLVVGSGFTSTLTVTLTGTAITLVGAGANVADASATSAAIIFAGTSDTIQADDTLIGGSSSNDVLNLTFNIHHHGLGSDPILSTLSLAGMTDVEKVNVTFGLNPQDGNPLTNGPIIVDTALSDLNGTDTLRIEVFGAMVNVNGKVIDAPIDASAATANILVIGSANVVTGSGNDRILLSDLPIQQFGPNPVVTASASGGSGNDRIAGGARADTIQGNAGADQIVGQLGADTLTGGADADTFIYLRMADSNTAARDTITDFVSGVDVIDARSIFDQAQLAGDTITFVGNAANLAAAQALLTPLDNTFDVVFQQDQNILWFDNGDGILNGNDLQIVLTGVASLIAQDVMSGTLVMPAPDFIAGFIV